MKAYLEIEMPETCCACPLFKVNMSKQNFCKAFGAFDRSDYDKLPFERLKNCPLVPVPPHGRLVDEENICGKLRPLIENPYCYNRMQIISDTLAYCLQIISDAPTVIPASGKGKDVPTRKEET